MIKKKNNLFAVFLLALLIVPMVSAVTLESGTVFNTSISNSSMSFLGQTIIVDQVTVGANGVELYNATFTGDNANLYSLPVLINWSDPNSHIDSGQFISRYATSTATSAICNETLSGLQQFGNFLPIIIIVVMAGVLIPLLLGSSKELDFEELGFMLIVLVIIVGIGAVIIARINTGAC